MLDPSILSESTDFFEKQREETQKKPIEWKAETTPEGDVRYNVGMDAETLHQMLEAKKFHEQTLEAFHQEIGRIDKQRSSGNPILDVLQTVGGELAVSDPRLPPVVAALGRASLKLNPSQQELSDRKLSLMQAMSQIQSQEARASRETQNLELDRRKVEETESYHKRELEEKQSEKALQSARLTAQKGGGPMSEGAFTALMAAHGIKDSQKIADAYAAHQEQSGIAVAGKEAEQAKKVEVVEKRGEQARETEEVKARNRYMLADHNRETGLGARKAFADYKEAIKKDEGLSIIPPKDKTSLIGLRETERYINGVDDMLNDPKFASLMGGEKLGRYATRRLTSEDRVKLENYLSHETPRILNLVLRGGTGGASLLRTEEGRAMIRKLGVMTDLTVPQAKGVIDNIKKVLSENRRSTMDATPEAPWDKYPDLLGSDSGYRPGGASSSTPSYDDFLKWKKQ